MALNAVRLCLPLSPSGASLARGNTSLPFPSHVSYLQLGFYLGFCCILTHALPSLDSSQEKCQERHTVLPDGVWCQWNWYVYLYPVDICILFLSFFADGDISLEQDAQRLSTHYAARKFSKARMQMTLPMLTSRRVSASSLSQSVSQVAPKTPAP